MNRMQLKYFFSWAANCFLIANCFSCAIEADIFFSSAETRILVSSKLEPAFLSYWNDLRQLDSSLELSPFSHKDLQKMFGSRLQLLPESSTKTLNQGQSTYELVVKDWTILQEGFVQAFQFQSSSEGDLVTVIFDRTMFLQLGQRTILHRLPGFTQLFSPREPLSPQDCQKLLTYFLEPYTPHPVDLIGHSFVELRFHLPRPVKKVQGASFRGQVVTCRWSLVQLITLEHSIKVTMLY